MHHQRVQARAAALVAIVAVAWVGPRAAAALQVPPRGLLLLIQRGVAAAEGAGFWILEDGTGWVDAFVWWGVCFGLSFTYPSTDAAARRHEGARAAAWATEPDTARASMMI